jgi:hypothetical protein
VSHQRRSVTAGTLASAVALPALAWAGAAAVDGDTADAMLNTAALLIVAAPLAGVISLTRHERTAADGRRISGSLVPIVAWALTASVASGIAAAATSGDIMLAVTSHAAMAAVALALAATGAAFAAVMDEPLDAAACSLLLAVVSAGAVLTAGTWTATAPAALIRVAIAGNPFIAVASAAHIDVARLDLFYRISPLAHLGVEYPAWYATCGWYSLVAVGCFVVMKVRSTTSSPRAARQAPALRHGLGA